VPPLTRAGWPRATRPRAGRPRAGWPRAGWRRAMRPRPGRPRAGQPRAGVVHRLLRPQEAQDAVHHFHHWRVPLGPLHQEVHHRAMASWHAALLLDRRGLGPFGHGSVAIATMRPTLSRPLLLGRRRDPGAARMLSRRNLARSHLEPITGIQLCCRHRLRFPSLLLGEPSAA